mmetsp:Transcript_134750/g.234200  ORF Transcript_134750/g.234200 Transcript_134750/m.234200 type:complete len:93 (+) Transcript_134750:1542-1820(+)
MLKPHGHGSGGALGQLRDFGELKDFLIPYVDVTTQDLHTALVKDILAVGQMARRLRNLRHPAAPSNGQRPKHSPAEREIVRHCPPAYPGSVH